MKKSKLHKLREVLLELGVSQKDLSEKLKITPQSVNDLVGRDNLSLAYIYKLSIILEVEPSEFILDKKNVDNLGLEYLENLLSKKRRKK